MLVKIKKVREDAVLPSYAHEGDAGMDIFSVEDVIIEPGKRHAVSTGISVEIPEGYVALIWDKSGLASNSGIKTMAGVIDCHYRGEWKIVLFNTSNQDFEIKKGQKIAQALIQPVVSPRIQEAHELSETSRGQGAFGSTGLDKETKESVQNKIIIGITGKIASGKDSVSDFLKERGFEYISLSKIIREIAQKNNIEITRKSLQDLGNKLREQNGIGCLAEEALKIANEKGWKKFIIDGIRNSGEIEVLRKQKEFFLISIDASQQARYQRLLMRNKLSDPKTWEGFLEIDNRDKGIGENEYGQQVGKCMALADIKIMNDRSFEEFRKKIQEAYMKISGEKTKTQRPSWNEYFMDLVEVISTMSIDKETKVGAVIVDKQNRIVSTGYNAFPPGVDDDFWPQNRGDKIMLKDFGENYEIDKYDPMHHAEINAIANSVRPLDDCTIYTQYLPCNNCAKTIISCGIKKVVYKGFMPGWERSCAIARELFKQADVEMIQL